MSNQFEVRLTGKPKISSFFIYETSSWIICADACKTKIRGTTLLWFSVYWFFYQRNRERLRAIDRDYETSSQNSRSCEKFPEKICGVGKFRKSNGKENSSPATSTRNGETIVDNFNRLFVPIRSTPGILSRRGQINKMEYFVFEQCGTDKGHNMSTGQILNLKNVYKC